MNLGEKVKQKIIHLPEETKRNIIYFSVGSAWKESLPESSKPQASQEFGIQIHTTYVVGLRTYDHHHQTEINVKSNPS